MNSPEKKNPQTPEMPVPPEKIRIEVDYDMVRNSVVMRSLAPTVVLTAILRQAQFTVGDHIVKIPEEGVTRRVRIDYDLKADRFDKIETDAPDLIFFGIIEMAIMMICTNQALQLFQRANARTSIISPEGKVIRSQ